MKKAITILSLAAMMALAGCDESDVPLSSHQIGVLSHVDMPCIEGHKFAVFFSNGKRRHRPSLGERPQRPTTDVMHAGGEVMQPKWRKLPPVPGWYAVAQMSGVKVEGFGCAYYPELIISALYEEKTFRFYGPLPVEEVESETE